jgi:protein-tyrosine-phosphatase/predicted ATP-grasp superfamily ATP-dependent carboligase
MMRHRPRFASISHLIMANDSALNVALSKYRSIAQAIATGIETPVTWFVCDGHDLNASELSELRYPCILKSDNVAALDGSYLKGRTWLCAGPDDLLTALDECLSVGARAVAQELVPGRGVGAFLFRRLGQSIVSMTHERLHEVPYTGGWSSYRVATDNTDVRTRAERLLTSIDFDGLAMVEFRTDESGTPRFIEINGRLWGSIALALHAGCDFPTIAVDAAFGLQTKFSGRPRVGTRCINLFPGEFGYLASLLRRPAEPARAQSYALLRGAGETLAAVMSPTVRGDFFWRDDPAPGLAQCRNLLRLLLRRALAYARSRFRRFRRARLSGAKVNLPSNLARILVLCSGNICRSPFAERLLRERLVALGVTDVVVASAGLHARPGDRFPQRFQRLVRRFGVDLSAHRSKAVDRMSVQDADTILVMELEHIDELVARFPEAAGRTLTMPAAAGGEGVPKEILDPYLQSAAEAAGTFYSLALCVHRLAERIAADRVVGDAVRKSA